MLRLPPHDNYENFVSEVERSKRVHRFPTVPQGKGTIAKISFICGCHGTINAHLRLKEEKIPSNGIFEESSEGPYADEFTLSRGNELSIYKNKATYKTTKPIFEFDYLTINVRDMNVTLSTTNTCLGATVKRPSNGAILKQKFINDIMENMSSTCPTNTLIESSGKYGETFLEPRSEYESKREQSSARKITRLFTNKKYILLSSSYEIEEEFESIYDDFSRSVKEFFEESIGLYEPDKIQGRTHDYPSHKITLFNLLRLAKMIITEINGIGSERTVPIEIYDLSCNSFGIFKKRFLMNEI